VRIIREIKKFPGAFTKAFKPAPHIAIFNYHQVSERFVANRHSKQTWTSFKLFKKSITYIQKQLPIISLTEAIQRINDRQINRSFAVITFDDGDRSILDQALPWLAESAIKSTLFVNSSAFSQPEGAWGTIAQRLRHRSELGWTDEIDKIHSALRHCENPEIYHAGVQRIQQLSNLQSAPESVFLTKSELSSLDEALFEVGMHGRDHQRFIHFSSEWQRQAILDDQQTLSDLPHYIPVFAIPFGRPQDWSYDTLRIAWELGLEVVLADGGVNHRKQAVIQRIPADRRHARRLWKKNRTS
jgi:peptidoglycan/xylan/chitin deacetylase (PgdA/CDA1 family)